MCVGYFYAEREHSRHAKHLIFHYALFVLNGKCSTGVNQQLPGRICAGPRVCVCVSVVKTILEVGRKFVFPALCAQQNDRSHEGTVGRLNNYD